MFYKKSLVWKNGILKLNYDEKPLLHTNPPLNVVITKTVYLL